MGIKVFIADDSRQLRASLSDMLLDIPGVQIAGQAGDVTHAIKGIRETEPDAVVLDLKMPGGSGLDVVRDIRENQVPTTVLVFTSYPFPEYRRAAMKAGAGYFFEKGADEERLMETVKGLMEKSIRS
ncbi:MAG: response regulator transcription factor [Desulfotignum sp.]|nr:response regulator transcription factor [Desulfotignum sp.]MCF8088901.1 response regulator transcription factor [Desulfotignum sp.]MCF8138501.1 response regulator transcription factor [Desulfotignum sp.]